MAWTTGQTRSAAFTQTFRRLHAMQRIGRCRLTDAKPCDVSAVTPWVTITCRGADATVLRVGRDPWLVHRVASVRGHAVSRVSGT